MGERYSRLFSLQENLYTTGSPVVIAAGALLKDNETGKVLAQIKLRSISPKAIKAATVEILPYDVAGNSLGGVVKHQYLDIKAVRGNDFGQKNPVALPDANARAYSAIVSEVVFEDNTVWRESGLSWEALPTQEKLKQGLCDDELVKQYKMKYGSRCGFMFQEEKDLWMCSCGAVNHKDEEKCHSCSEQISAFKAFELDKLKADCEARLAEAQKKAAEDKAAAEAKAKKTKKLAIIITPIVIVAIIATVLLSDVVKKNQEEAARLDAYNSAVAMAEAGKYDDAIAAFSTLGDYKDSAEKIAECETSIMDKQYDEAIELAEEGKYSEAKAAFEALDGYKDSHANIIECENALMEEQYNKAVNLYHQGDFHNAWMTFEEVSSYNDSLEMVEKCKAHFEEPYYGFLGTYSCDEGYTITISDIIIEDYGNTAIVVGTNTSYIDGAQSMRGTLTAADRASYDFQFTYRAGSDSNDTTIYVKLGELEQYYNGHYNYTYTK